MLPRFLALAVLASVAVAAPRASRTSITVWSGPAGAVGGSTYGGVAPSTGALVVEHRDLEIANNEIQLEGVSASLDPASVQLRDLGDPGLAITQQRFVSGAATPAELITRHIGETITVTTPKGDLTGVLRSADDAMLALEIAGKIQVVRRDFVQVVHLPTGPDKSLLAWKVRGAKPGTHAIEVSYRTDAMGWTADYMAILDENGDALDFSAWATIKNSTGTPFTDAMISLVGPANARFELPAPVQLGANDAVQVEMIPSKRNAKAHAIVAIDAEADEVAQADADAQIDCTQFMVAPVGAVSVALEVDLPSTPLPDGHIRMFRRIKDHLEVLGEDDFHMQPGHARLKLAGDSPVTLARKATACTYDDQTKVLREKVELKLVNTGKQALDAVVHETMWRSKTYTLEAEQPKSSTVGELHEYRVRVPAGGKASASYTVVYTW
jgi:hypothetical protein